MFLKCFICAAIFNLFPVYVFTKNVSRKKRSDDFVPCDNEWFNFGEKCYKLGGRIESEKVSWGNAEARCIEFGGNLVSIHSAEENDFIISFLLLDIKENLWIGLHDRDHESQFSWTDGSNFTFSDWGDSEPSGTRYRNEDCVEMLFDKYLEGQGSWNDLPCEEKLAFICQTNTNMQKRSPNPQYCSSEAGGGWKYQNSCYHIIEEMKTWQNAEQHCKDSFNGHLVTVLNIAVDTYLAHLLSKTNQDFWIGIKIQPQFQQKWSSGYFVTYNNIKTTKNATSLEGSCVLRKRKDLWIKIPCSDEHSFICEVSKDRPTIFKNPINGTCPESPVGWRDLGGEFCYFIEAENQLNWYEADIDCKRRGGNLLSIHSNEENDVLHTFFVSTEQKFFIGLYRLLSDVNVFVWSDGSDLDYESWAADQPNSRYEKCTVTVTTDMLWHDYPCRDRFGYICSVKKIISNTTIAEETKCPECPDRPNIIKSPTNGSCPESPVGWRDLGGEFCYFIEAKNQLMWYEADIDCKRRGGNLLSIHSKEENDVLSTFFKYTRRKFFIGLFRLLDDENIFVWSDGSDLDYENWATYQPNNYDEKCTVTVTPDMLWHDYPCTDQFGYICSVRKISPNTAVVGTTSYTVSPITAVERTTTYNVSPITAVEGTTTYNVSPNTAVVETTLSNVSPNTAVVETTLSNE